MESASRFRRYIFKLYPTSGQIVALDEQRQMVADLWNALLEQRELAAEGIYRPLTECFSKPKVIDGETRDERKRRLRAESDAKRARQKAARESGAAIPVSGRGAKKDGTISQSWEISRLLAARPEWRAFSTWTPRAVSDNLHCAFQAFFRRAKAGLGAQSGYPRFKRRRDGNSIPHRCLSGCRLSSTETRLTWKLELKGVPGPIHARGCFPSEPKAYSDADVLWRDGRWWLSICCELARPRLGGNAESHVRLGVVDGLAAVNGVTETPDEIRAAQVLQGRLDALKSERDNRWPSRAPDDPAWVEFNGRISKLAAKIARKRHNALHVWSARLVRRSQELTVTVPKVKEHTATPHGDVREWGASTEIVSKLNRDTLSKAPAIAAAMLTYKATEAGIRFEATIAKEPEIAIGEKLVAAGKKLRKAKRALAKENHNEHNKQGIGGTGRGDRRSVGVGV